MRYQNKLYGNYFPQKVRLLKYLSALSLHVTSYGYIPFTAIIFLCATVRIRLLFLVTHV